MINSIEDIINRRDSEGNFILSPLPCTDDHFEPYIGACTIKYHYYKHLKGYIDKVNVLKKNCGCHDFTIRDFLKNNVLGGYPLYQNASQVYNHYIYFEQLKQESPREPLSVTRSILDKGGFTWVEIVDKIKEEALSIFGSGWVFLTYTKDGMLKIRSYIGAGTPLDEAILIVLDVWEHAYYLDYQNDREMYVDNFFKILDWSVIENRCQSLLR